MRPDKVWLFGDLLEKNKRVFKVPVYQRNYVPSQQKWTQKSYKKRNES